MWKVSKYGVFSGPNTGKYGPEKTPYLDTSRIIFVGIPCEFAVVPDVHFLLYSQEEEAHFPSWRDRYAHLVAHSSKKFKPLSAIIILCLGNKSKNGC